MFGDLFEEDEEGFSSVPSGGRFVKGKEAEPPPPRGNISLSGIKNQGGTCYLNSLIQTLLFTPEFRGGLVKLLMFGRQTRTSMSVKILIQD